MFVLTKHELYIVKSELLLAYKREKLSVDNMKQAPPEKLAKPVSIVTTWGNFRYTRRNENGRVVTIGPMLFDTFLVSFVSSQGIPVLKGSRKAVTRMC
jgi:hypothetical protein